MKHVSLCIAIAILLLFGGVSHGAVFLPDPEELDALDPREQDEALESTGRLLADVPPDQGTIRVDDMVFDIGVRSRASAFNGSRWVDGRVWYEFDGNVTEENRARWREAAAEWEAVADLSFRERTDQYSRIYVKSGDENWSKVGLGAGGKRDMELTSWSSKFVIAHEIGHALGLLHEHCRTGRGDRIDIHWSRIEWGKKHNFYWAASTRYGGYDFDSIMHYPKRAFPRYSTSGNTITMLSGYEGWLDIIGQRDYLSARDKQGMAERYGSVSREVTYPQAAGIRLVHGETCTIRWRGFTDESSQVELLHDGDVYRELAAAERGSSLEWNVPADIPTGGDYQIRVTSTSDGSRTATSDHAFSIVGTPRVLYPNAAAVQWALSDTYDITWENMRGDSVSITLLREDDVVRTIASSTSNDGVYSWHVPNDQETGVSVYKIRVESISSPELADASDSPFTIKIAPRVTSPVYGDGPWLIGETYRMSWRGFPEEDERVQVILETSGSSTEQVLTASTRSDYPFSWTVPDTQLFGSYYVRVESVLDPDRFGRSEAPVRITGNQQILEPAGSDLELYKGGRVPIRWTGFVGPTVRILANKNYYYLEPIVESTPNDGYFLWTVPDYSTSSGDFFSISISSEENPSQYAESEFITLVEPPALVTVPSDPGEAWPTEISKTIQWVGYPGDTVSVYVYRGELTTSTLLQAAPGAGGPVWTLSSTAPNTGSYSWTPHSTMPTDTEYRVRVVDNSDPDVYDDSDNAFTIYPGGLISPRVTYPTASDVVVVRGADCPIHWRHFMDTPNVRIDLFKDGDYEMRIADVTGNDGVHFWTIPPGVDVGPGYKIRVQSISSTGSDYSDHPFTVEGLQRVTSPSDPDYDWYRGDTMTIEWEDFHDHFETCIELYRDGVFDRTIVAETLDDGSYEWEIPDDLPIGLSSSGFQIKVTTVTNAYEYAFSVPFRIVAEMLASMPAIGTGIRPGGEYTVSWSGLSAKTVRLDLFQAGRYVRTIASQVPNTGFFSWKVAPDSSLLGSGYQVRIVSSSDPYEYVFLKEPFQIVAAPAVIVPTGRSDWRCGRKYEIKWQHFEGSNIQIVLTHEKFPEPRTVVQSTPNTGAYTWMVPTDLQPAGGYGLELTSDAKIREMAASEPFSILLASRVSEPSKTSTWLPNTQPPIEWSGFFGDAVAIDLCRPNFDPVPVTSKTTNDGSYDFWTVPAGLEPAADYQVQVVSLADPDDLALSEPFSLAALPPTVFSPRSVGEVWYPKGEYAVEWTGFTAKSVRVELYRGRVLEQVLDSQAENTGLLMWVVPGDIKSGDDFSIKVTANDVKDEYAWSGGPFAITEMPSDGEPPVTESDTWTHFR